MNMDEISPLLMNKVKDYLENNKSKTPMERLIDFDLINKINQLNGRQRLKTFIAVLKKFGITLEDIFSVYLLDECSDGNNIISKDDDRKKIELILKQSHKDKGLLNY